MHINYNTQHAPIGANASFTLGMMGKSGGLGIGLAGPALENFWIGIADPVKKVFYSLPFFEGAQSLEALRFGLRVEENSENNAELCEYTIKSIPLSDIKRHLTITTDLWEWDDFSFTIYTQAAKFKNPLDAKLELVPGLICEMKLDNARFDYERYVVFGWQGSSLKHTMRVHAGDKILGIAQGQNGFFAHKNDWNASLAFTAQEALLRNLQNTELMAHNRLWGLGTCGVLSSCVPARHAQTKQISCAFFEGGIVTTGRNACMAYTNWWNCLEDVAQFLLDNSSVLVGNSLEQDKQFLIETLSADRYWMLAQAVHSYYGSTQMIKENNTPLWLVNEGEYRMINTLDLTIDQLFYELTMHPWTVKSVLEQCIERYSYRDNFGISFAHDMGVANAFSVPGRSAYELAGLTGCFSFMTAEELINFSLCAISYVKFTNDIEWFKQHKSLFIELQESLQNRCAQSGVIQVDSDRCMGGSEITTYDSLDPSLGQARENLYLAVKCLVTWKGFIALWNQYSNDLAKKISECKAQANAALDYIKGASNRQTGLIPALLDGSCDSAILPAIEALVFPAWWGELDGYTELSDILKMHTEQALRTQKCVFPSGGLKLSESSNNSWLSKIYLWQCVFENVLHLQWEPMAQADAVHKSWLLDSDNALYAWSDQMLLGKVCGSRYYPRGVTAALWVFLKKTS